MANADHWLDAYGSHGMRDVRQPSQWLGVPLTVASLVGILWSLPIPQALSGSATVLNWATFFLMATVVYYFILSISLAFGSLPFVIGVAALCAWLDSLSVPLGPLSTATFLVAFSWQLAAAWRTSHRFEPIGHLQQLMIGPLWLLAACYRRLGIRY